MKKWLIILVIPMLFFLIGCENYRCEVDTEIEPEINVLGSGDSTKIVFEYKLGTLSVLDTLKDVDEVDGFFFHERKDQIKKVRLKINRGQLTLNSDGTRYYINTKEYRGEDGPSMEILAENEKSIPGLKWKVYDGVEYKPPLTIQEIKAKKENKGKKEVKETNDVQQPKIEKGKQL